MQIYFVSFPILLALFVACPGDGMRENAGEETGTGNEASSVQLPGTSNETSSNVSRGTSNETSSSVSLGNSKEALSSPPPLRTRLVLLGTGTPIPVPQCAGPSLAVVVDDHAYLVDAGTGIVRRAAEAAERGVAALQPEKLSVAFLTHLHSDHTLGYPDLIFTPWVIGRDRPPHIFGPPGLKAMTGRILEAWTEDIVVRKTEKSASARQGYQVEVHEISPGEVYRDDRVRVTAFPVDHGAWKHAFGYRFDTPDRSIVISGDTRPTERIVEACSGCDILVHEVYASTSFSLGPLSWQAYHQGFHTSSIELAALAAQAKPGLLVLYHQLLWGQTEDSLLREITSRYEGKVHYGRDLDIL